MFSILKYPIEGEKGVLSFFADFMGRLSQINSLISVGVHLYLCRTCPAFIVVRVPFLMVPLRSGSVFFKSFSFPRRLAFAFLSSWDMSSFMYIFANFLVGSGFPSAPVQSWRFAPNMVHLSLVRMS